MNCMLNLPRFSYYSPESVASFLTGSKWLNPRLIALVEEEACPVPTATVAPGGEGAFVARIMDLLYHYSAVYDSLEVEPGKGFSEAGFLGARIIPTHHYLEVLFRQGIQRVEILRLIKHKRKQGVALRNLFSSRALLQIVQGPRPFDGIVDSSAEPATFHANEQFLTLPLPMAWSCKALPFYTSLGPHQQRWFSIHYPCSSRHHTSLSCNLCGTPSISSSCLQG
ncbi:hypothetical protein F8388_002974 [Cannabis sativa]|uniref:Uncharacterized protein n=1 Tax=Cannabis sativa TaxID=3483 RepID=A0A7J6H441_CANSA|nr:hypothetical protein F8388_002974 [Cannabis sativa]